MTKVSPQSLFGEINGGCPLKAPKLALPHVDVTRYSNKKVKFHSDEREETRLDISPLHIHSLIADKKGGGGE